MLQTLHKPLVKIPQKSRPWYEIRPKGDRAKTLTETGKLVGHWRTDDQGKLYCQWIRE